MVDASRLSDALLGYQVPQDEAQFSYASLADALAAADESAREKAKPSPWTQRPGGGWTFDIPTWLGNKARDVTAGDVAETVASATPLLGNALSARDAYNSGAEAVDAVKRRDWVGAGLGAAGTGLGALGSVPLIGGIFAGPLAKTANKALLKRAEKMAASGVDRGDIWRDTGWFKGADDKWRFEIPDNEAAFNVSAMTGPRQGRIGYAEEVATHPYLYSAYPEMKNIPIAEQAGPNLGAYHPGGLIELNLAAQKDPKQRLSTTLHELQHGVQEDEGFAFGGDPRAFTAEDIAAERASLQAKHDATVQRLAERYKRLGLDATPGASLTNPASIPDQELADRLYARLAGEVEARNVQARRNMTPAERRETPPWATEDVPGAEQIVRMGGGGAAMSAPEAVHGIRAYHGSPHDFDRFDMSKVGTGEGAQAYGHGLYFAESEPVARSYRDQLSGTQWHPEYVVALNDEGRIKTQLSKLDQTMLDESLRRGSKPKNDGWGQLGADILPDVAAKYKPEVDRLTAELADIRQRMQSVPQTQDFPGRMYEVNINADPDHFLDWDKPLSEQSEAVKAALMKTPGFAKSIGAQTMDGPVTKYTPSFGELSQRGLVPGAYDRQSPEFSKTYLEAGIPGVKYFDQGSRASGEGSRNYVVFDDALISIARKYGIPGAIAMGLLTQEQGEAMAAQGY